MFLRDGSTGRTAFGAWVKLPGIESTEIFAAAGFDFCVVDLEHTLLDTSTAERHIVVGTALGMRMFVRVPDTGTGRIQRLLDGGASGILVPHVDEVVTAKRVIAGSLFPPHGTRGSGGTSRAGGFGMRDRATYLGSGGGIVAQIESVDAVRALSEIAPLPGLGAIMLGPADLGLDPRRSELGTADNVDAAVISAARAASVPVGIACSPQAAAAKRDAGFDFVICANDTTLLASAAHDVVRGLHPRRESPDA